MVALFASRRVFAAGDSNLVVKTRQGKVEGIMSGPRTPQVRAFLGIPYAAPPIGPLRWKEPMPATKWSGVRAAKVFGLHCMQPTLYADMIFRDPGQSEDCLTLNVWTPATSKGAKLPVMVWIYGGGFQTGGTSEARQDGANLATRGVVVVSMNYRLGIFGFFAHPDLAAESGRNSAGNYGLLDQTAALRWVQANVKNFGGDPHNVTLFGESAGSASVSAQMASPLAKGLFQRTIGESGGEFAGSRARSTLLKDEETEHALFAQTVLSVSTLEQLRALPAEQLLGASRRTAPGGEEFRFNPIVDGYFLPESPAAIFAAGRQNDVPMLAGWNRDEGGIAPQTTMASFAADVERQFGDRAPDVLKLYSATSDEEAVRAAADLAGDRFIAYSTWRWIEAQSTTGHQPIYWYRFDLAPPPDPNHTGGLTAYHSAEIPYVFGNLDLLNGFDWRPEDRQLSDQMQRYWTNFARKGDPNGEGLPQWPVYKADSTWIVMHLGAQPAAAPDANRQRDLLLSSIWGR